METGGGGQEQGERPHFNDEIILPLIAQVRNEKFPAEEIVAIEGQRVGSKILLHRGFQYRHDGSSLKTVLCVAHTSGDCPGALEFNTDGSFYLKEVHVGHDPEAYLLECFKMTKYVKSLSDDITKSPCDIYGSAALR